MITVDDVVNYLGIDYLDNMVEKNIMRAIKSADAYLKGSVGYDYPTEDPRAKEIALMLVADMYDNRTATSSQNSNMRKLLSDMMLQLRLELRGSK